MTNFKITNRNLFDFIIYLFRIPLTFCSGGNMFIPQWQVQKASMPDLNFENDRFQNMHFDSICYVPSFLSPEIHSGEDNHSRAGGDKVVDVTHDFED